MGVKSPRQDLRLALIRLGGLAQKEVEEPMTLKGVKEGNYRLFVLVNTWS